MATKKEITKVAKKEITKAASIDDLFAEFTNENAGLLQSIKGSNGRASLYKEELLKDMNDREKKAWRKKIRNGLINISESILTTNGEHQKKLINAWKDWYKKFYAVNNYTLLSICSENMSYQKKQLFSKVLEIVKE